MTEREHLIALQDLDTAIDQLRIRIDKLPERAAVAEATATVERGRASRRVAEQEKSLAEAELAVTEKDSAEIDTHRTRLQAQMKTIISPREAEALQREMATLSTRRDELDDRGLDLLERIGEADTAIEAADAAEPALLEELASATAALDQAAAVLQAEVDGLVVTRTSTAADVPAATVARYDRLRSIHGGTAIARLVGLACTGCHIELSLGEAEQVRHVPIDELPDCTNCGRVLLP